MNKMLLIIVALVVLGGAGYYFMQSKSQSQPATQNTRSDHMMKNDDGKMKSTSTSETKPAADTAMKKETTGNIKEFVVEGKNFAFVPTKLEVNKGDKVKVTFKNTGGLHDFVIDEFNAKTQRIKADEEETIEFTADKAGSFEFYCSVGNHRAMGMVGKLIVK